MAEWEHVFMSIARVGGRRELFKVAGHTVRVEVKMVEIANDLAKDGWELADVAHGGFLVNEILLAFRRPRPEPAPDEPGE